MEQEYISIKEASRISGLSVQAIYDKVKANTINFKVMVVDGRKQKAVEKTAILRMAVKKEDRKEEEKAKAEKQKDAQEQRGAAITSLQAIPEKAERMRAALAFSKSDAETVLKVEQAIAKQSENLVKEKRLIDVNDLHEDYDRIFFTMARNHKSLLDKWTTDFRLSPEQAKQMREDFEKTMRDTFEELKKL